MKVALFRFFLILKIGLYTTLSSKYLPIYTPVMGVDIKQVLKIAVYLRITATSTYCLCTAHKYGVKTNLYVSKEIPCPETDT